MLTLYFISLYICTLTKVKRFPGCHARAVFPVRRCEHLFFVFARTSLYVTGYIHFTLFPYIYGTGLK